MKTTVAMKMAFCLPTAPGLTLCLHLSSGALANYAQRLPAAVAAEANPFARQYLQRLPDNRALVADAVARREASIRIPNSPSRGLEQIAKLIIGLDQARLHEQPVCAPLPLHSPLRQPENRFCIIIENAPPFHAPDGDVVNGALVLQAKLPGHDATIQHRYTRPRQL